MRIAPGGYPDSYPITRPAEADPAHSAAMSPRIAAIAAFGGAAMSVPPSSSRDDAIIGGAKRGRRTPATKTPPRAVASCGLGRALKRDVIAEALKPTLQVCDGAGLTDLVEIGFSEVAVRQPFGQHVI